MKKELVLAEGMLNRRLYYSPCSTKIHLCHEAKLSHLLWAVFLLIFLWFLSAFVKNLQQMLGLLGSRKDERAKLSPSITV